MLLMIDHYLSDAVEDIGAVVGDEEVRVAEERVDRVLVHALISVQQRQRRRAERAVLEQHLLLPSHLWAVGTRGRHEKDYKELSKSFFLSFIYNPSPLETGRHQGRKGPVGGPKIGYSGGP
jgi:hypothetical protein